VKDLHQLQKINEHQQHNNNGAAATTTRSLFSGEEEEEQEEVSAKAVENLPHQHHYLSPPWKMDHQQHLLMTNITIKDQEEKE
jgi:hypothetical protein